MDFSPAFLFRLLLPTNLTRGSRLGFVPRFHLRVATVSDELFAAAVAAVEMVTIFLIFLAAADAKLVVPPRYPFDEVADLDRAVEAFLSREGTDVVHIPLPTYVRKSEYVRYGGKDWLRRTTVCRDMWNLGESHFALLPWNTTGVFAVSSLSLSLA